jgi:thiamine biosynthesis lipoprotein
VLGRPTRTRLAHPHERARAVLELELRPGSLATSGNAERGIRLDGESRAHILDPRAGAPVADFGSLSVWAADASTADCLSTGLYAMGPEAALAWAARHPEIELVLLFSEGPRLSALATQGWRGRVRVLDPDLELRFVGADSPVSTSASLPR